MKLEKVSDQQIRCTITKNDLSDRHMKLSELAYGSIKAKQLFRDMLAQASAEFGFEADNMPLMIEAIPFSGDCIVLIITKVEDPDELDSRFSKFAPSLEASEDGDISENSSHSISISSDDIYDFFKKLSTGLNEIKDKFAGSTQVSISSEGDLVRMYRIDNLNTAIRLSHVLKGRYRGENTLYKCDNPSGYYLILKRGDASPEEYNKVCNTVSEYGSAFKYSKGQAAYLNEHSSILIDGSALQELSQISIK